MNNTSMVARPAAVHQQKPIRFVTNNDGPYAKRRRINSACLTCRRRKTRCSGEKPVCGTCIQNKHECGGYGNENDQLTSGNNESRVDDQRLRVKRSYQAVLNEDQELHTATTISREVSKPEHAPLRKTISGDSILSSSSPAAGGGERRTPPDSNTLSLSTRNRMPYFRYFGPTAIMPGFKQMVVKVRGKAQGTGGSNSGYDSQSAKGAGLTTGVTPSYQGAEEATPVEIPVYDTSAMAPPPLITTLCKLFFSHVGCNFPFLQKDRFMRDLEEKQVDSILVDAVCGVAARFSTDPMFTGKPTQADDTTRPDHSPSDHGAAFSQRAKSAIADTFACPSVAVVQAALLLAYDEFGASRDSGLWMYLGIAIRMAQDLGMQTLEGLRYEGRTGPNPQSIKLAGSKDGQHSPRRSTSPAALSGDNAAEQKAVERERIDTFWTVFFLDRVISSGTGRPVTLRDRDIEISFPPLDEDDVTTGWPAPFPALIRVIHLYGRVTDLLNSIRDVSHVTPDVLKKLKSMEVQLTEIYQGLSSKLHFNAINFQHYVKAGQGTNFILLHLWFHTLIVLLHQPTLLKTFEGEIEQVLPNSRELSMSSAKTIADILAFAELIDSKTGMGSPFSSQPIYIAACAFLKEISLLTVSSNPQSRLGTPPPIMSSDSSLTSPSTLQESPSTGVRFAKGETKDGSIAVDQKKAAKDTLLATAANQNYHRCYRGLKYLEYYWSGCKYILTVLDQKAKGVGDPLLYDREEMESALEVPQPEAAFTSPGWRRKLSWGTYLTAQGLGDVPALRNRPGGLAMGDGMSAKMESSQAIGWSLTGTMNSPCTSLAVLYSSDNHPSVGRPPTEKDHNPPVASDPRFRSIASPSPNTLSVSSPHLPSRPPRNFTSPTALPEMPPPNTSTAFQPPPPPIPNERPSMMSDADLLLNLHSPYSTASPQLSNPGMPYMPTSQLPRGPTSGDFASPQPGTDQYSTNGLHYQSFNYGDMMIESQDIDISALNDDAMSWFEYLPPELMGMYENNGGMPPPFPHSGHGPDTPGSGR